MEASATTRSRTPSLNNITAGCNVLWHAMLERAGVVRGKVVVVLRTNIQTIQRDCLIQGKIRTLLQFAYLCSSCSLTRFVAPHTPPPAPLWPLVPALPVVKLPHRRALPPVSFSPSRPNPRPGPKHWIHLWRMEPWSPCMPGCGQVSVPLMVF